jgi:hypothetical protein
MLSYFDELSMNFFVVLYAFAKAYQVSQKE